VITADEAKERVRQWAGGSGDFGVFEFDLGYVLWPDRSAARDTAERSDMPVFGLAVVDKETGEVTRWPPFPPPLIAERYSDLRAAEHRFSREAVPALRAAGWFPGRDVADLVADWLREERALTPFPAAMDALGEFGGLRFSPPVEEQGRTVVVRPSGGMVSPQTYVGAAQTIGVPVFPLAVSTDGALEFIVDTTGQVWLARETGFEAWGPVDEMMTRLALGGAYH
jgi:hypothetical protein